MKCKIIGYSHLQGVSKKTNKSYDFYNLSVSYQPERGYTGERVAEFNVDPTNVTGIEKLKVPVFAEILKDAFTNKVTVVL